MKTSQNTCDPHVVLLHQLSEVSKALGSSGTRRARFPLEKTSEPALQPRLPEFQGQSVQSPLGRWVERAVVGTSVN